MQIRRANRDDAEAISRLAAEVQELHYQHDSTSYKAPDATATVQGFRQLLDRTDTVAFIAEDEQGCAIGYVVTFPRTVAGNGLKHAAEFVELNEIGVTARWRRQGIGRALHGRVIEHWTAAGAREIRLTVIGFNSDARRYYEQLGFVEASRRLRLRLTEP